MVGKIKTVNGVKKIVPLTAEARAGNPVSTIIAIYSNLVPYGYLPCNGVQFDETQFPALYAILGDNHTPDLRECALVGAGQNATDTIATHDVYNVGQFKDDQLQDHSHNFRGGYSSGSKGTNWLRVDINNPSNEWNSVGSVLSARAGDVTRGKRKGVNYCIKATAGLDESDADYVLGVLAPVDEVAVDNMHSVTSNAVAEKISSLGLSVSSLKTILDDSDATLKVRTYGKIAIFTAYAKRSCTKHIDITNYEVNLGKSLKSGMTWGKAIYGEAFVSDTDPKTFVISCDSECSTEVVAFLK